MKIIHQIWFDFSNGRFPSEKQITTDFIARTNPDYQYIFWDLDSALKLTKCYYPAYHDFLLQNTNRNIIKCDFFRYVLMYHFGGFYFDLDFVVLRSLDILREKYDRDVILTEECHNSADFSGTLHNGFLFSKRAGDVFWKRMCDEIVGRDPSVYAEITEAEVYSLTGTKYLCEQWQSSDISVSVRIKILPFYVCCNHWFTHRVSGEQLFYTKHDAEKTIHRKNCSWSFLSLDDIIRHGDTLRANHAVAICAILPHGSFWKS